MSAYKQHKNMLEVGESIVQNERVYFFHNNKKMYSEEVEENYREDILSEWRILSVWIYKFT